MASQTIFPASLLSNFSLALATRFSIQDVGTLAVLLSISACAVSTLLFWVFSCLHPTSANISIQLRVNSFRVICFKFPAKIGLSANYFSPDVESVETEYFLRRRLTPL